jgi:hypothetical protein
MFISRDYVPDDDLVADARPSAFRGEGSIDDVGDGSNVPGENGPGIVRIALSIAMMAAIPIVAALLKFLVWGPVVANH